MKETILQSKKYEDLKLQIFDDNEFGLIGTKEDLFTDNGECAYELFKLLKEADKRNCFNKFKGLEREDEVEHILI